MQQTTTPDDCLISKENRLHFLAGRLSTPHLSLISTARLFSGLLPAADIAAEADQYDCPVLVYADTFDGLVPDLRSELDDVYALRLTLVDPSEPDYPLDVYAVQLDEARRPQRTQDLLLGDQIRAYGSTLRPAPGAQADQFTSPPSGRREAASRRPTTNFSSICSMRRATAVANYDHYPFALDPSLPVDDVTLNPPMASPASRCPRTTRQPA